MDQLYGRALRHAPHFWWVPYLLINDPVTERALQERFATHACIQLAWNGIRPDTLHVCFHVVFVVALILLCILTRSPPFRWAQGSVPFDPAGDELRGEFWRRLEEAGFRGEAVQDNEVDID